MITNKYDFQHPAIEHAIVTLTNGQSKAYVSPTGSGKSYMEGAVHRWGADHGLVTVVPSVDIGRGIYNKTYTDISFLTEAKQMQECEKVGLWTVMRLRNALLEARIDPPKMLQIDEGHHSTSDTYVAVRAYCGDCPAILWTATYYRGTPDETAKLRAMWGEPYVVLTERDAVARGIISQPDFTVWPLLNDDLIKVENGEFQTKSVESHLKGVDEELCERIKSELCTINSGYTTGIVYRPLRPTMICAPGVASARRLMSLLRERNVAAVCITGDETDSGIDRETRAAALARVSRAETILVQVKVVGEGVDLPLRVCVDCAPTMSPLRWMQGPVGRIRRPVGCVCTWCGDRLPRPLNMPGLSSPDRQACPHCFTIGTLRPEPAPLYIATNHNLTRHAYLLGGLIPAAQIKQAQTAWGPEYKPARRTLARAIGLEGFGKFTVSQVPLLDGSYMALYALQTPNGTHQYAVLLHPCVADPLFFERSNPHTGETKTNAQGFEYKVKDYGPWKRIKSIPDLEGYVSVKPGIVTEPMMRWWRSKAERCGLDPDFKPNAREFVSLPVLCNSGTRFKVT